MLRPSDNNSIRPKLIVALSVIFIVSALSFVKPLTAQAATPRVVINELMYHAVSSEDDDYLELYNADSLLVDMSGWCFSGITLCFNSGTVIQPHEFIIVSRNTVSTQNTYGVTPIANYTGNLSNSGETIMLKNISGNVVDEVTYSDRNGWSTTPDGSGSSLELKDPLSNHDLSSSWAASLKNGGTPGTKNSVSMVNLPSIVNVNKSTNIQPGEDFNITAKIENATSVKLVYKVMFNNEVVIDMHDDGNHNDGTSSDSAYGASIPNQAAGTLVRYKIVATNNDGSASLPSKDDAINYHAYIVNDGQASDIPIVRWYMAPADFDDMTTNHLYDQQQFSTVVAVGDQIFDNAKVRVKGQSSVSFPKRKYKFELPNGQFLTSPFFEHPVSEFAIQTYMLNFIDLQEGLMWKAFKETGFKELQNRYVRVQKNNTTANSQFYGHYLLIENYDSNWRTRNNYNTGAMYKEATDKKTRKEEDNSDIQSLYNNITTLQGDNLKRYLTDNLNIPAIVNYHAVTAVTSSTDWHFSKNIYEYRDTEGSGRWEYLPWDLDNGFLPSLFKEYRSVDFLKNPIINEVPSTNLNGSYYYNNSIIEKAMYQFPEFREMFFRRSMNVYDQIWGNNKYMRWFNDMYDKSEKTMDDDAAVWNPGKQAIVQGVFPNGLPWNFLDDIPGAGDNPNPFESIILETPHDLKNIFIFGANKHKEDVLLARQKGQLLGTQTAVQESKIKINEIMRSPSDGEDYSFIELYNSGNDPVDVSNWKLSDVGFSIAPGTVIPARSYGLIVKNDKLLRAKYPGKFILGEYNGDLSPTNGTLQLKNSNDKVISSVAYGTNDPWPSNSNLNGKSLSLIKESANTENPACWVPSVNIGGTPAQDNDLDQAWLSTHSNDCDTKTNSETTVKNKINDQPVHITTPESSNLTCDESIDIKNIPKKDSKYDYPLGLIKFCFDTDEQDNQVKLIFVTDLLPAQVVARKYNEITNKYMDINNSTITKTTYNGKPALQLVYNIRDNGELDQDKTSGKIVDPASLAVAKDTNKDLLTNTGTKLFFTASTALILIVAPLVLRHKSIRR